MAGIYVHVPFCASRCIYCDFYSTTNGLEWKERYVQAVCAELQARHDELEGQIVHTIYFGGGTPSLLSPSQLNRIMLTLRDSFVWGDNPEITLESNPDDVTLDLAKSWNEMGFNRVSLGLQTFHDDILRVLRRRHTSETARDAVQILRTAGFRNLTLDLIYGLPGQNFQIWQDDVRQILEQPVQHLSAYALSYEPGTVLSKMRDRNEVTEADEDTIRSMYMYLMEQTAAAGFTHYEISNFARPGYVSRHNSSYWQGVPYLGVGPGAHSYDGYACRRANLPNLKTYVGATDDVPHQVEKLSENQIFEEYILTRLRTKEGILWDKLRERFGEELFRRTQRLAAVHINKGILVQEDNSIHLSKEGILISDYVMSDLMLASDEN